MADTKISALTDGATADATDRLPVARAGANRYITPAYLGTYLSKNTLAAGTLTASAPMSQTQTWNNAGVDFKGLLVDITSTLSGANSFPFQVLVNTGSMFRVRVDGEAVANGAVFAGNAATACGFLSASGVGFLSRGLMAAPSDGVFTFSNAAATDFGRMQLGGTTSSFPALKRSGVTLETKLADDSAYALHRMAVLSRTPPVTETGDFTVADTTTHVISNRAATNTATLPSAASFPGREIYIRTIQAQAVVSASSNVVPRIGGAASTAILAATDGAWALLVSDGTNWECMAGTP